MPFRRILGAVGRTMMTAGALILLFVAYQLWGTGIQEARSQDALSGDFAEQLARVPREVDPADVPPPPPEGEAVATIKIPKIGVDKTVVEGVSVGDLKKAPGHYPGTPMPGQPGNAAIAGHRTTYGAPFQNLDELAPGDTIFVTTLQGRFRYEVSKLEVVKPSQVEVLDPTDDNRLTLTTCHPEYSAAERLILTAALVGEAAVPLPAPARAPRPASIDGPGLSGESTTRTPAVLWGLAAAAVWLLAWAASRVLPKIAAYGVGVPVFLVVLFFFFENFARLLPANA